MRPPKLSELPSPPTGKTGWPWTEESPHLPRRMHNDKSWPRVSVITPSYNQGSYIESAIRSVLLQGYPDLEYILIDGGSTDSSIEVIRRYEPWLAFWVSEKDRGQADALRKGFDKAHGDLLGWINSDDLLAPTALRYVAEAHADNPHLGVYAGAVENFNESSQTREVMSQRDISFINLLLPTYHRKPMWHQPGIFFSAEWYWKAGGVNAKYFYRMDYDLLLRMLDSGARVCYVDKTLAHFRQHGRSKTGTLTATFVTSLMDETYEIAGRYLSKLSMEDRERFRHQHVSDLLHAAYFAATNAQPIDAASCLCLAVKIGRLSFYHMLFRVTARGLLARFERIL